MGIYFGIDMAEYSLMLVTFTHDFLGQVPLQRYTENTVLLQQQTSNLTKQHLLGTTNKILLWQLNILLL